MGVTNRLFLTLSLFIFASFFTSQLHAGIVQGGETQVSNGTGGALHPSFYIDASSNLHLVWEGNSTIYYTKLGANGQNLTGAIAYDSNASLPVNEKSGGSGVVAYQKAGTVDSVSSVIADLGGQVIGGPEIISNESAPSGKPAIAAGFSDAYSAWQSLIGGTSGIFFRPFRSTWEGLSAATTLSSNATSPAMGVSGGNLYFAWSDDREGDSQIFFRMYKGNLRSTYGYADSDSDGLADVTEQGVANNANSSYDDSDPATTTNGTDFDTDSDGLPDGWRDGWLYDAKNGSWKYDYSTADGVKQAWEGEDLGLDGRADAGETDPNNADNDSDGMADGYEKWYGLDALADDSASDPDNDTLANLQEFSYSTDPKMNDSDSDGLNDSAEIAAGTNPLDPDSDDDGLLDGAEISIGTNPLGPDSDDDLVMDGFEQYETSLYFMNCGPAEDCDSDGLISALDPDSDNDGIPDGIEFANGTRPSSPVNSDTDHDGILDAIEDANRNGIVDAGETGPANADSDGDGLWDGSFTEMINESTGYLATYDFGEANSGTNPLDADSDNDGLNDLKEVYGWKIFVDGHERRVYSNPLAAHSDADGISDFDEHALGTDPSAADSDADLIPDDAELNTYGTSPSDPDTDNDGLYDGSELARGTLISNPDTDSDGLPDSEGDWVEFRTSAADVNRGALINETLSGGCYLHQLKYAPSSVSRVVLNSGSAKANTTLANASAYPPLENQYYLSPAPDMMSNGWVAIWRNISVGETLYVSYLHYYNSTAVFDDAGYYNFTLYAIQSVNNASLEAPVYSQIELAQADSNPASGQYAILYGDAQLETGDCLQEGESLEVHYYSSNIDYADSENNGAWIAVDRENDLDIAMSAYGRVDGLALSDSELQDNAGYYHGATTTNEGYSVGYTRQDVVNVLAHYVYTLGASEYVRAAAWRPQGDYALAAGNGIYAVLRVYPDGTVEKLASPGDTINSIAWTADGNYALLAGSNGRLALYNASSGSVSALSSGVAGELRGIMFSNWGAYNASSFAIVVGSGGILRVNATSWQATLLSAAYDATDIAYIDNDLALITLANGSAFMYDWFIGESVYHDLTPRLSPAPDSLLAADWRRSVERNGENYSMLDSGLMAGYRTDGYYTDTYLYECSFSGSCRSYLMASWLTDNGVEYPNDVKWSPAEKSAIVAAARGDSGFVRKWDYSSKNFSLVPSADSPLYGIGFHPSGGYATLAGAHDGRNGYERTAILQNYMQPYAVIYASGDANPVFGDPRYYSDAAEAYDAETAHGSIPSYNLSGQEKRNLLMDTDPLNPSTLNDGMLDGDRLALGYGDSDHDFVANFLEADADNDGILNGEEAYYGQDFDQDNNITALDPDADGDGIPDGTEAIVAFRTNASYGSYEGAWIGVEADKAQAALQGYAYADSPVSGTGGMALLNFTLFGKETQVRTPEGYAVYMNGSDALIDLPGETMARFVSAGIPDSVRVSLNAYAMAHKETYDYSAALTHISRTDSDNDGLVDLIDPTPYVSDTDADGLLDGFEKGWNSSMLDINYDGLPNYNDSDSDADGLPDGWIDGWCYNETIAAAGAAVNGSIAGWGKYCAPDGMKQAWEGEDLNLDGGDWWSMRYTADGEVRQTETNPWRADTDADGLLDGEERLLGTDPIYVKDTDGDGISDYRELREWFVADAAALGDYAPSISDLVADEWNGYSYPESVRIGQGVVVNVPLRLARQGMYRFKATGTDTTGVLLVSLKSDNGTVYADSGMVMLSPRSLIVYTGELPGGAYELTLTQMPGTDSMTLDKLFAYRYGLDFNDSDTDHDGIIDGKEEGWGSGVVTTSLYPDQILVGSSPLDPDTDDDGLLDSAEVATSPINPDTDGDSVTDYYDLSPSTLETGAGWADVFAPGTLYYNAEYYLWELDGHSYSTDCVLNIGDNCAKEYQNDLGEEGVRNSPADNNTREWTIENAINSGFDDPVYFVANMSYGVPYGTPPNDNIRYSYSTTRHYGYGKTGITAAIDDYPRYDIKYDIVGRAYSVVLANSQHSVLVEGTGWVPLSDKTLSESVDPRLKYVYNVQPINVTPGKANTLVLQIAIDPASDQQYFESPENYTLPALEYRLYDGAFGWSTGVMSSIAIAKPIELLPARHTYEFVMTLPKDKLVKGQYLLYLSPMYIQTRGEGNISRYPLNKMDFQGGALVRTVEGHSYTLVAKLGESIDSLQAELPEDVSSVGTGSRTMGSYNVYSYNGPAESFNATFDSSALSSSDAILLYSDSASDISYMMGQVGWTPEWYFNNTDFFGNTVPVYSAARETLKTTYIYDYFTQLSHPPSYLPGAERNASSQYYLAVKHNASALHKYAVTRANASSSTSNGVRISIERSATHFVDALNQSAYLADPSFAETLAYMESAHEHATATLNSKESVIMLLSRNDTAMNSTFVRIANYAGRQYENWAKDTIKFGTSTGSMGWKIYKTSKGKMTLGIFQKSFAPANKAAKAVEFGPLDAVFLAKDVAVVGYNIYTATNTDDPIMRRAAYESVASSSIDLGLSIAAIAFPPAGVITPAWVLTYYAIWAPLKLLDKAGLIEANPGPFAEIAISPSESLVFVFQFESGVLIPSAVAQDAFESAIGDMEAMMQGWYEPAILVRPE